ncbi:hypothetical protein [Falsirhodobacter halotolerans]|nr:hypothetical protein [Falsirhodobacter halotolerans]
MSQPSPTPTPGSDADLPEILRQALSGLAPSNGLTALIDRMERPS